MEHLSRGYQEDQSHPWQVRAAARRGDHAGAPPSTLLDRLALNLADGWGTPRTFMRPGTTTDPCGAGAMGRIPRREDYLEDYDRRRTPVPEVRRLVDLETGEISDVPTVRANEGDTFIVARRRNRVLTEQFVMLTHHGAEAVTRAGLSAVAHEVLWAILASLTWENRSKFNVKDFCRRTGRQRRSVQLGLEQLVDADLIRVLDDRPGRVRTYLVNPNYFWKGASRKGRQDTFVSWALCSPADDIADDRLKDMVTATLGS